ncbi:MAG: glycerol kinase GlpK [Planctomycetota bacterium]|jgi:glycerol kinase|nr:glycerol kinase GlpK [Planctomycetota bacterium]
MALILALDQGTSSSRAVVLNDSGERLGSGQHEFTQHFPHPGWVEHDAGEILRSQLTAIAGAMNQAGCSVSQLAAIGLSNQRETIVMWDRATGEALAPAIVWQDRRTATHTATLRAGGHEALVRERTGLVLDPYFSASKIAWLLDAHSGLRARARAGDIAVGTIDSWLIHCLSGGAVHCCDISNASRTSLFNIHTHSWDQDLLDLFDIPAAVLPQVVASAGTCAMATALGAPVPICGMAGDQQAALFGQACTEPGLAKITYGTGAFALLNTGTEVQPRDGVLSTIAWQLGTAAPVYANEGSVFIAGAAVQWLRDQMGFIENAADIEALANSVPDSGGVVFVPAFAGLATPHWDADARGLLIGLTRGTERGHIARATLEAIAWQSRDALVALGGGTAPQELRVDGGAASNRLLLHLQANALGCAVLRPHDLETTVRGAAGLAMIGADLGDVSSVAQAWSLDERCEPSISADQRQAEHARWNRALERTRNWNQPDAP